MKEKTINTIKVVVALVLLVGIGVGLFFGGRWFIGELDGIFLAEDTEQTDDTNNPSGGDQSSADQSGGDTADPAFYVDTDGYGYRTIDGVTVFFQKVNLADRGINLGCVHKNETISVFHYPEQVVSYGAFVLDVKWSFDSILWNNWNYSRTEASNGAVHERWTMDCPHATEYFYVSYTSVSNCTNPMTVLLDLKANAFDFGTTYGSSNPFVCCTTCLGLVG